MIKNCLGNAKKNPLLKTEKNRQGNAKKNQIIKIKNFIKIC